ncbi:MAG: tRNA dihydrouridine(20/20a) synthase DusA [Gammaproteobacteria bacterium]
MQSVISVAPMMDYTDRHFRYLLRLISPRTILYTEMVTTQAILRGDQAKLLGYHPQEHPLVLQLGGSVPEDLARCAQIGEALGYDAINLNVGCPSDRVQQGRFGACLMKEPALVADCLTAMRAAVKIPVTLKMRLGVDDYDSEAYLQDFTAQMLQAGCDTFIVHARKAWLKGLSPKENRTIPPLCYEAVYRLKQRFPTTTMILNGGLQTVEQVRDALSRVDGVMLGRQICKSPYLLAELDRQFYPTQNQSASRSEIYAKYYQYIQPLLQQGLRPSTFTRHLTGLFYGISGTQHWRRILSTQILPQPHQMPLV